MNDARAQRCANDSDGDGNCATCARNPQALCRQPVDEEAALFEELWSMEYRICGDQERAKEFSRDFLNRHAHAPAERIRVELAEKVSERLAGGIWEIRTVSTAQQAADLIDPEVT